MKKIFFYISLAIAAIAGLPSCNGDYAQPPMILPEGGLGEGTAESPKTALQVLNGSNSGETAWVTGYIVGWVDTANSNAFDEQTATFTVPATVNSNLIMAMNPDERNYEKCIVLQLPNTDVRTALNLVNHPDNLGKLITVKGTLEKYFGTQGVKNISAYNWGNQGIPEEPVVLDKFVRVDRITSGKEYAFVANNLAACNIIGNYGYLQTAEVKGEGDEIELNAAECAFCLIADDDGYYIRQMDNRYFYMQGTYNNFNVGSSTGSNGLFTIEFQEDGTAIITNQFNSKFIQYDPQHNSYGAYSDFRGVLPYIYEKAE